ncbi:DeoR/GlpR family DNA-binding transcription regulator [Leucobacter sp. M11]|uniref:DeoR/GlpR family DNA-binding transcription regulator n=1 Tax=Leucobacter sp. M11 TaxID=2993565 RepID=UPI002D7F6590|nr:DeoR/GlpR family DNA-binding transcription regulator [Leucobacter sp. M11]MEB4616433.1 DeoR/GlpR family DNA-binding transcription regulator [Leucobacter sp. M11]
MIPAQRQRAILQRVRERGTVSIPELVELLDVSHMTVRRDIAVLEETGRVVSVSGGVSQPAQLSADQEREVKAGMRPAEKSAIARAACALVEPGSLVYLDAGTTTLAIAHELAERPDVSVITNDLVIATFLSQNSECGLSFVGGSIDRRNLSSDGAMAAGAIGAYNIDIAFVSTSSFDLRAISVPNDAKQSVKDAIMRHSAKAVLATDSSKYGKKAQLRAVELARFDTVITDPGLPQSVIDGIREQDVTLILAAPDTAEPPGAAPGADSGAGQPETG